MVGYFGAADPAAFERSLTFLPAADDFWEEVFVEAWVFDLVGMSLLLFRVIGGGCARENRTLGVRFEPLKQTRWRDQRDKLQILTTSGH